MGCVLLDHIEPAERGYGLRSRLAVDGQTFCFLKGFGLFAGGAEMISVVHVQPAEIGLLTIEETTLEARLVK